MLSVRATARFKRRWKQAISRNWDMDEFKYVIGKLAAGESLPAKYADHALKGNLKKYRDVHVRPDRIMIYKIE